MHQIQVLGAALLQRYEDYLFPKAYASKKLLPRENNYCYRERMPSHYVLTKKIPKKIVWRRVFVLQTDHEPLSYIQKCKIESGKIM